MDVRPTTAFATRRARLAQALRAAGGGVALLATAPPQPRNGDSEHPFRFDSHFHYLSGFGEPHAWLLLESSGRSTLFCQPKDDARELWEGECLGPESAPLVLGLDAAYPLAELDTRMPELLQGQPAVWTPFGQGALLPPRLEAWFGAVRSQYRRGWRTPAALRDLGVLLDDMRLVKDATEIATMRRAGRIATLAHVRAMRHCRPGQREYQLEAELLHEFRRHGASGPAYPCIVAAGANACVLHHPAGGSELRDGDLCLIDAGCEVDGYASDVTRTFPVNGRFSTPQREIYELVLAAQRAAVAATRPGARKQDAHWAAVRVISQGLLDLRLLDAASAGTLDDVIERALYTRFFMHGTGHWLGLDVHDVGDTLALDEPPGDEPDGQGGRLLRRPSRVLEPGMVVTIEPGLYIRAAADVPEAYWNLGVRIEDDALVTPGGCELLSADAPVSVQEIEALVGTPGGKP